MKLKYIILFALIYLQNSAFGQNNFSVNPLDAVFETSDVKSFWSAFDKMGKSTMLLFLDNESYKG
ncbi:hypothetical protein [Flavobacterium sp. DG2-3]|uniref:hypothetical protein n=1 Tax=Flavobacterium sp. DG2-3 TaxID=3068317 RepID=UPI0027401C23|nr:hypothetical protein [Flavobacterium sp. DG2-3]MDP5198831.1 hypothetical protein [Flavobacterium sp. DG2-3]